LIGVGYVQKKMTFNKVDRAFPERVFLDESLPGPITNGSLKNSFEKVVTKMSFLNCSNNRYD